jgi:tetratricopeptide (TPR) repeat protein
MAWLRCIFLSFTLTLLFGSKVFAQPVQKMTPEIKQLLNNYYFSIETADQQKALTTLTALIAADSTFSPYYAARASVNIYRNHSDTASIIDDLSKAIQYDTANTTYYKNRAKYLWQSGREVNLAAAVSDYYTILKVDTFYLEAYENLYTYYTTSNARSKQTARKIEKSAQNALSLEVQNNPFTAESYYRLSKTYCLRTVDNFPKRNLKKALAANTRAIALDSTVSKYRYDRAMLYYFNKKDYEAAISDLDNLIANFPSSSAYYYKASCLIKLKRTEDALAIIELGLLQFPADLSLIMLKNEIYNKYIEQ